VISESIYFPIHKNKANHLQYTIGSLYRHFKEAACEMVM